VIFEVRGRRLRIKLPLEEIPGIGPIVATA
jgi:hypothetical protein